MAARPTIDTETVQLKHYVKALESENLRLHKQMATLKAKHVTEINELKAAGTLKPPQFIVQVVETSFTKVAERIAASNDPDAKASLRQLLECRTAGDIVGSSAAALLTSLDA